MDAAEKKAKADDAKAAEASRLRMTEYMPKPGIVTIYPRGAYTVLGWIDEEGGYQETVGVYDRNNRTLKVNGGRPCSFITNQDLS